MLIKITLGVFLLVIIVSLIASIHLHFSNASKEYDKVKKLLPYFKETIKICEKLNPKLLKGTGISHLSDSISTLENYIKKVDSKIASYKVVECPISPYSLKMLIQRSRELRFHAYKYSEIPRKELLQLNKEGFINFVKKIMIEYNPSLSRKEIDRSTIYSINFFPDQYSERIDISEKVISNGSLIHTYLRDFKPRNGDISPLIRVRMDDTYEEYFISHKLINLIVSICEYEWGNLSEEDLENLRTSDNELHLDMIKSFNLWIDLSKFE